MSTALEIGILGLLESDQSGGSFYDDITGRITSPQAPQNQTLPHCVFNVLSDPPDAYFSGDDIDAEMQIDLWGTFNGTSSKHALGLINDKLITLLDKQSITITGFTSGEVRSLDRGTATIEEDAVRILSRWRILASA